MLPAIVLFEMIDARCMSVVSLAWEMPEGAEMLEERFADAESNIPCLIVLFTPISFQILHYFCNYYCTVDIQFRHPHPILLQYEKCLLPA